MRKKKKKRNGDRWERFDWWWNMGEVLLFLPRMIGRLLRKVFDWY